MLPQIEILKQIFQKKTTAANYVLRKLKVWWPMMPLFLFYWFFFHTQNTFKHTVLTSINIRRGSSPFHYRRTAQWQTPSRGAELRFKLGPPLQRAHVLPIEPRRTLILPALVAQCTGTGGAVTGTGGAVTGTVAQCVKGLLPRKSNQEVVGSSPGCDPCSIRK